MDPIMDAFITSPIIFVTGFIIAISLLAYKKIMLFLNQLPKKATVVGHLPVQNFSGQVLRFERTEISKETIMQMKETSEVIIALDKLIYDAIQSYKGEGTIQIKTSQLISLLMSDKDLHEKCVIAFSGYENIPEEFKGFNGEKAIELIGVLLPLVIKYFQKSV